MRKTRKGRVYRTPTRKERSQLIFGEIKLNELFFDEEQFMNILDAARRRVIGEFYYATEPNPRYQPGSDRRSYQRTDNYIWGVSNKLSDLARYVQANMHQPFVSIDQLPPALSELEPHLVDVLVRRVQHEILELVLVAMRHHEIWYDEGVGIWQVCQSSVDYFLDYRKVARSVGLNQDKHTARSSHRVKADTRPFHGRVRSQSKNRGIPAGVSVSYA